MDSISLTILLRDLPKCFAVGGLILWCIVVCLHLVAVYHAKFYLYSWRKKNKTGNLENADKEKCGVTIVKTVTTYSPAVLSNLESVFKLNYPLFELMICVHDKESDVIPHIEELVKKYPHVDVKLYTGALNVGVNPKINNIMQCYNHIRYNYIWICDSNIYVNEWTLDEMASHIQPNLGMVHQLPYIAPDVTGKASCLEKIYFGTHHGKWYLIFDFFHAFCTNGMSSIINKQALDEVGGLSAFSNYIAEDYFMGKSFFDRGYKIVMSSEPAYQNTDNLSIKNFINRLTRWQKLRLTMLPFSVLEPLIECIILNIIGSFSFAYLMDQQFVYVFLKFILLWHALDEILLWLIEEKYSSLPSLFSRITMWIFREVVTYYVFVVALWDRRIHWSMGIFDLKFGGQAFIITKESNKQP